MYILMIHVHVCTYVWCSNIHEFRAELRTLQSVSVFQKLLHIRVANSWIGLAATWHQFPECNTERPLKINRLSGWFYNGLDWKGRSETDHVTVGVERVWIKTLEGGPLDWNSFTQILHSVTIVITKILCHSEMSNLHDLLRTDPVNYTYRCVY